MPSTRRTSAGLAVAGTAALGLTLLLPVAASAAPRADDGPGSHGCATGTLPAEVQGSPFVKAGADRADYVWHNRSGWHLRVTKPGHERLVFSGTINASAPIHYTPRRLEKKDRVLLSSDRKTLSFRFNNYGKIDGLDFVTDCASSVTFSLQAGGGQTPVERIDLGRAKAHPTSNPFSVTRTPRPADAPAPAAAPQV